MKGFSDPSSLAMSGVLIGGVKVGARRAATRLGELKPVTAGSRAPAALTRRRHARSSLPLVASRVW